MIPDPSKNLADLAGKLVRDILPETSSAFAMASTGMIGMLLQALAQDTERAVDTRMTDADEMKQLFAIAGDAPDQIARARFASDAPASLQLRDVETYHARGMTLLIGLHEWAETNDPALDAAIWQFLQRHTDRNRFDLES